MTLTYTTHAEHRRRLAQYPGLPVTLGRDYAVAIDALQWRDAEDAEREAKREADIKARVLSRPDEFEPY